MWLDYLKESQGMEGVENEKGLIAFHVVGDIAIVQDFYVRPEHRGSWAGIRLVNEAVKKMRDLGCKQICGEIYKANPMYKFILDLHIRWGMNIVEDTEHRVITTKKLENCHDGQIASIG